jgi:hypothetical protein
MHRPECCEHYLFSGLTAGSIACGQSHTPVPLENFSKLRDMLRSCFTENLFLAFGRSGGVSFCKDGVAVVDLPQKRAVRLMDDGQELRFTLQCRESDSLLQVELPSVLPWASSDILLWLGARYCVVMRVYLYSFQSVSQSKGNVHLCSSPKNSEFTCVPVFPSETSISNVLND